LAQRLASLATKEVHSFVFKRERSSLHLCHTEAIISISSSLIT
jgi:hypothetical protein